MKNKITLGLFTLVLVAVISSCSTSSDVASNRKIQKRKYNKGFFVGNNKVAFNKNKKEDRKTTFEFKEEITIVNKEVESNKKIVNNDVTKVVENTIVNMPSTQIENSSVIVNEETIIASNVIVLKEKRDEKIIDVKNKNKKVNTSQTTTNSGSSNSDLMLVVLVILAIIIPPLAVFIYEGVTTRFWIDLILALLSLGGWFLLGGLTSLLWLLAVIFALLIVLEVI